MEALRGFGFAVFARPKTQPDDDIDQDMLDHIAVRAHSHRLRRLVVFSGDGRNFAEPLEQLVREGTHVVVVAFSEVAGYAISSELLEFIDIEDVPGAFVEPLDRVRLDALPPDGAWLRPTRSLRDFVSSFTARRAAEPPASALPRGRTPPGQGCPTPAEEQWRPASMRSRTARCPRRGGSGGSAPRWAPRLRLPARPRAIAGSDVAAQDRRGPMTSVPGIDHPEEQSEAESRSSAGTSR